MKKNLLTNLLKTLTLFSAVFGLLFVTSCGKDDDDCDNKVTFYADADLDGLGDANTTASDCEAPGGFVTNAFDNNDNASTSTSNIYAIIQALPELDSLEKYISVYPDLVGALQASGTYTFFAPTNAAFVDLLETPNFPKNISSINPDIIKNVLAYHISVTQYSSTQLTSGTKITTINKDTEEITVNPDGTLLTGSTNPSIPIEATDVPASNGTMHIVGSVLIPHTVGTSLTPILGTNGGTLLLGANFSILAQAILKADTFATVNSKTTLVSMLTGTAFNTVFAPSNGTFETLADSIFGNLDHEASEAEINAFLNHYTGAQFYGIIATHIVMDDVEASELTQGATLTAASGATLTVLTTDAPTNPAKGILTGIAIDSNGDTAPEAQVAVPSSADEALSNGTGRVHVIAGLLTPPQ